MVKGGKKGLKVYKGMRILDNNYNIKYNIIKINIGNTLNHEMAKCKLSYLINKSGKKTITEAIFKNGCRADIYVPEDMRVYEILESETQERLQKKLERYPEEVDVIDLTAKEVLEDGYEY